MKKFGPLEHVSLRDFLRFYVFLNKMVKNGPRNMKFGTNVVCTIENNRQGMAPVLEMAMVAKLLARMQYAQ